MRWASFFFLTTALTAQSALIGAGKQAAPADMKAALKATDRNGDNRIDRAEYQHRMMEVFYFEDADKNSNLTRIELEQVDAAAFKAADRDGNDLLSTDEYINARVKDFSAADKNSDGVLTLEEIE
jgi:hypothetical protein